MSNNKFYCSICNKGYVTKKGYENHMIRIHNHINSSIIDGDVLPSTIIPLISKAEEQEGWNKDQIELALEMSMKEQFKDYIPDPDEILEMSSHKACLICASQKVDAAFVECGHMIACLQCANKIKNSGKFERKCPVCRKEIKKVLKIYT